MPKKRTYNFKQLQGQASPKSKPNGRKDVDSSVSSVNERLGELRKIEGVDAAQKKRLFAESLNQPSVPVCRLQHCTMTFLLKLIQSLNSYCSPSFAVS